MSREEKESEGKDGAESKMDSVIDKVQVRKLLHHNIEE
jgi:hypothetical protein